MPLNHVQFPAGLSLPELFAQFGTESQCEAALERARPTTRGPLAQITECQKILQSRLGFLSGQTHNFPALCNSYTFRKHQSVSAPRAHGLSHLPIGHIPFAPARCGGVVMSA
jgi:hypothetical protein